MTKRIPLTKNLFALVDDDWFDYLSQWKWSALHDPKTNKYYARRTDTSSGKQVQVRMHRLLVNAPKDLVVDHKDGNTLNNTIKNLRICTRFQNMHNQGIPKHNKSGYKGVSWNKRAEKWVAKIVNNRKQIHLGLYDDKLDAALAYDRAAKTYHGEFASLNFSI